MGVWEILSLLQQHRCQTYKGAHQNPAAEEETSHASFLVSQMGTAADTRVAAAQ